MTAVLGVCAALLAASALLVLFQIERGPSSLDRMVGVDVMTSILLGALAVLAASTRRADLLVVFVVVAVSGFLGSVAVARFAGHGRDAGAAEPGGDGGAADASGALARVEGGDGEEDDD